MGWWLQLIGLIFVLLGGGFGLAGFIISPQKTVIQSVANLFSEKQSIKTLPPSLGGNDVLNLDNIAILKLHVPYNEKSLVLLLDVVPTELSSIKKENFTAEGIRVYNHNSGTEYIFDTNENKRHKISVSGRIFIVTLQKIKKLDIADVANPLEFEFGISEVKN